jgi:hypothetical protein
MPSGSWSDLSDRVLGPLFAAIPLGTEDAEVRRQVRDAYPFGERKYHPYKVWLKRVAAWRHAWTLGYQQPIRTTKQTDTETLRMEL